MASDVLRAQLDWLDESSTKADESQLAEALAALTQAAPGDSRETAQLREQAGALIVSQLSEARREIASLENEARQATAKQRASEQHISSLRACVGHALRETSASKEHAQQAQQHANQLQRELHRQAASLSQQASIATSPQPASVEAAPPSPMLVGTTTATAAAPTPLLAHPQPPATADTPVQQPAQPAQRGWWAVIAAFLAIVGMLVATSQPTRSATSAGGRPALGGLERAQRLRATYTASCTLPIAARLVWASAPDLRPDQF